MFKSQNALEAALVKAADDPTARAAFLRRLLTSSVIIESIGPPPPTMKGVVTESSSVQIGVIQFNGHTCIPFFTSPVRFPKGTSYVWLDALELFRMMKGSRFVMNPGSAFGKEFSPNEITRLLDGSMFLPRETTQVAASMRIEWAEREEFPQELLSSLSRLYEKLPVVNRAWVAFRENTAQNAKNCLLIAVDLTDPAAIESVVGESGIVTEGVPGKLTVDFLLYNAVDNFQIFNKHKPFYKKIY